MDNIPHSSVCVTGASGFIGSWIVSKLLERGYKVHGTVFNIDDEDECDHLKKLEGAEERLQLFQADVLDYKSIQVPIHGCDMVIHTACPVAMAYDDPDDVLAPAIKGTENVLTACSEQQVKRVVMTSSAAAIALDPQRPVNAVVDESCWSDPQACKDTKQWYALAKTESEKIAWEFSKKNNLDLVVLCPGLVVGPMLQPRLNFSNELLRIIINGHDPRISVPMIDVRDVADAHILAMENPAASGRYYAFGEAMLFRSISETLKKHFPKLLFPMSDRSDQEGASNEKFRALLMREPIPAEVTLVDAINGMQSRGFM